MTLNIGDTVIITNIIDGEELEVKRIIDGNIFSIIEGDCNDGYVNNGIRIVEGLP